MQPLEDDKTWVLLAPLVYQSVILNTTLEIPAGYTTDLASVPRLPIVYYFWGNLAHHEAIPHDWIYGTHIVSKKLADLVFLEAMKARNKKRWIYEPMYLAVKYGGAKSYRDGVEKFKRQNPQIPYPEPLKLNG